MGYDMRMVKATEGVAEAVKAASQAFYAAVETRNAAGDRLSAGWQAAQAEVERLATAMDEVDIDYFRLNIWGMQRMCESMDKLGMLAYQYDNHLDWPDLKDFGLSEDNEVVWDDDVESDDPNVKAFREAHNKVLAWSPPDEPGIPVHKLGSNDGWIVTPLDCRAALEIYAKADPELIAKVRKDWQPEEGPEREATYFDEWIGFLMRGAAGSGFAVW